MTPTTVVTNDAVTVPPPRRPRKGDIIVLPIQRQSVNGDWSGSAASKRTRESLLLLPSPSQRWPFGARSSAPQRIGGDTTATRSFRSQVLPLRRHTSRRELIIPNSAPSSVVHLHLQARLTFRPHSPRPHTPEVHHLWRRRRRRRGGGIKAKIREARKIDGNIPQAAVLPVRVTRWSGLRWVLQHSSNYCHIFLRCTHITYIVFSYILIRFALCQQIYRTKNVRRYRTAFTQCKHPLCSTGRL